MKNYLICLFYLFILSNSSAQNLTIVNCFKGEKGEVLKTLEKINPSRNLYSVRSNSNTEDFERSLSYGEFSNNWLFMTNEKGDLIWKKMLPNTQNAMYSEYIYFAGIFEYQVFDYTHAVYSRLNDEIFIHYSYYDSLSSILINGDNSSVIKNNLLTFGIINEADGTYKTEPFTIDTLLYFQNDTSLEIKNCTVNKINDSIYQMAVVYEKSKTANAFNIYRWHCTGFYTINIKSKNITKNTFYGEDNVLINSNKQFYLLHGTYYSDNPNSVFFLNKINLNGNISKKKSLKTRVKAPLIEYIKVTENGKLFLGGSQEYVLNTDTKADAVIYNIDLSDLSFTYKFINNHRDSINSSSAIANFVNNFPDPYSSFSFTNSSNSPFCFFSENYIKNFNGNGSYENDLNLARLNLENGLIEWKQKLLKNQYNKKYQLLDLKNDEIFISTDSTFSVPIFRTFHHNTIQKFDTSNNLIWETILPDSVIIDSHVLYPEDDIKNYFPIDYNNQFIVSIKYIDTTNENYYYNKYLYFLISNTTGEAKRMIIDDLTPIGYDYIYSNSKLTFYKNTADELYIVTQESNKCSPISNYDIVIYKYNDVISSVNTNQNILQGDFLIFPNPASNTLNIKFNSNEPLQDATLKVYEISGRNMYYSKLENLDQLSIDISQFNNGTYFFQIDGKAFHQTKKVQIIH